MSLPNYTTLFAKYTELSNEFIENINAKDVTFHFITNRLETTSNSMSTPPKGVDRLGGLVPVEGTHERQRHSGTGYQEIVPTGTFKARIYWTNKNREPELRSINIEDDETVCKMITYVARLQDVNNASHFTIDGQNCKLLQPPIKYGLGPDKQYIRCFLKVM